MTTINMSSAASLLVEETTSLSLLDDNNESDEPVVYFLTNQQRADAEQILRVTQLTLAAIAIPATVCNVVVFLQKSMRTPASAYVIGISVAQLYYVIVLNLSYALGQILVDPLSGIPYCVRAYVSLYGAIFGGLVAQRAFYVIIVLLSLQRLYAVARPLHLKTFFLTKHPALCTGLTFFVSFAWHGYLLAKYSFRHVTTDTDPNATSPGPVSSGGGSPVVVVCVFQRTALYTEHPDINDAFGLSVKIVMTYCALSLQLVLNVLMSHSLRQHNASSSQLQQQQQPSSSSSSTKDPDATKRQQRERQMTRTILVTTVFYVILSLPAEIGNFLVTVVPGFTANGKFRNLYNVVEKFNLNLTTLCCGIDFFCFYTMSARYRMVFWRLLGCCLTRRKVARDLAGGESSGN